MSSATSTDKEGFHPSHFFVLVSLLAATVAVVLARPSAPEHLILISLTIGAAGLAGLAFYRMLAPLVAPRSAAEREPLSESMRLDLEREKALTLRSIKELEFDKAMGKVSDADFKELGGRLRAKAIALMQELDREPDAVERPVVAAPAASGTAAGACPSCGTANDTDARFCKQCGARLGADA